jgi:hypothetical protein
MRIYNPVPNMCSQYTGGYRQLPLARIAEDPSIRNSHHSYFIQAADAAAFSLYQWYSPSKYVRKKGARQYFRRLDPGPVQGRFYNSSVRCRRAIKKAREGD